MTEKKFHAARRDTGRFSSDRAHLVTYLQYAVADVALLNETSAALLQIAISYLESSESLFPTWDGAHKLS